MLISAESVLLFFSPLPSTSEQQWKFDGYRAFFFPAAYDNLWLINVTRFLPCLFFPLFYRGSNWFPLCEKERERVCILQKLIYMLCIHWKSDLNDLQLVCIVFSKIKSRSIWLFNYYHRNIHVILTTRHFA